MISYLEKYLVLKVIDWDDNLGTNEQSLVFDTWRDFITSQEGNYSVLSPLPWEKSSST